MKTCGWHSTLGLLRRQRGTSSWLGAGPWGRVPGGSRRQGDAPTRPGRGDAAPHGYWRPGRGPMDAQPKGQSQPAHPAPPGAGISTHWDRASMHYLQLHQPITLKQLHQHRGCWNALFCIDHNDTSQHYEPLRYFRPSTSEVTECQQAAEIKFVFSIKDWGVEGVRKKKKQHNTLRTYLETAEKPCTNLTSHRESASSGWTGFKYLKSYTMNWVSFNLCVFFFEDLLNTEDFLQLFYCHRFSNLYTSLTRGGNLVPENLVL